VQNLTSGSFARIIVVLILVSSCSQPASSEIEHPPGEYVVVNGAKLWYESEGQGETLLLIAGGPGTSHTYFHPYFSSLTDSCRVVYFDAFGRGKSDRAELPGEYTFDRDVEDIEAFRQTLGLGKINLLGHSYGGLVAQAYALRYPESIKKLILANTFFSGEMWQANNDSYNHEISNQYPEVWQEIQQLRAQGVRSSAKEHQAIYGTVPAGLFYFYNASNADQLVYEFNPEVYYSIAGEDADFVIGGDIARLDFRDDLAQLEMPALITAGRFDRVALPRFSIQFRDYAPQAEFVMFEHSGHYPFIEESAKMFAVVKSFLREDAR
jgi:proline iminopeptidase